MSGAGVSRFSLKLFDSNKCLNCSVEFLKNGEINVEKINNVIEVVDVSRNIHKLVSIASALNTVLRLPPFKRIDEEEGSIFGCCLNCTNLLSQVYELQKKLDALRSLSSVIATVLDTSETTTLSLTSEPEELSATNFTQQNSEIVEESLGLTCDELLPSSDSESESPVKSCGTETDAGRATLKVILETVPNIQRETTPSCFPSANPASAEKCPNCCVDLLVQSDSDEPGVFQFHSTALAKRGVDAVLHRCAAPTTGRIPRIYQKIRISDMLNNLLKLPSQNPFIREIRMCSDCAVMLLQVHMALKRFEGASNPNCRLNVFHDMKFMVRSTSTLQNFSKRTTTISSSKPDSTVLTVKNSLKRTHVVRNKITAGIVEGTMLGVVTSAGRLNKMQPVSDIDSLSDSDDNYTQQQTRANDSDSSLSMNSVKSPVSAPIGMTTRARSFTNLKSKCSTPVLEPSLDFGTTKQKLPVKGKRMTGNRSQVQESKLAALSTTAQGNNAKRRNERVEEPIPPKKGRPPRPGEDSGHGDEDAECMPQEHRKTDTKVLSQERIEQRRMKARAEYRKKMDSAEKIHKPCPHCGKIIKSKNRLALKTHIRLNHQHIGYHSCSICGKPIDDISQKLNHEKTHLNSTERLALKKLEESPTPKWLCPQCGKGFAQQSQLNQHSKTHADIEERRVQCPHCDFKCVCPRSMRSHIARTHDPSTSPRYNCKVCNQGFQFFNDLKEHGMKSCDASNRPFVCDQEACTSRFKLKHGLMKHLHTSHPFTVEQAREKLYPGLPCPDWVYGKYPRKKQVNKPRRVSKY